MFFLDIIMILAIFVEDHLKTISTKYHNNLASSFGDFQRVLYSHYKETWQRPLAAMFSEISSWF